ncbi:MULTISPECIES: hypothetical protein [Haloarcula]|uniref:hypothetical protein n=1 Tax=Haloarcula TaxID=2237 RepID=UPI0023EDC196|nr:hypothetical protein [Halomicroarcula sp. XH51]
MSGDTEEFSLPDDDDLADALNKESVDSRVYNDYKIVIELVNESDKPLSFDYAFTLAKDRGLTYGKGPFKSKVKALFRWNPDLFWHIAGQFPKSDVWVDLCAQSIGVDSVNSQNLNEVQQACTAEGDREKERYAEASLREFQSRALQDGFPDTIEGLSDVIEGVMEETAHICAKELPSRVTAMNNGTKSMAGNANEVICSRCLVADGFTEGDEFDTDDDNADAIVYRANPSTDQLNVEIKSAASRERASRAVSNNVPWVLFSFFQDPSEVNNCMFEGTVQSPAWAKSTIASYVPPKTLQQVPDIDGGKKAHEHKTNGKLHLRSNEEFSEDMQHYRKTGEIRDLSVGHES